MRITKEYDVRKKEILDASAKLFARNGYDKTSVASIIKEVEIAKGTFYHYFKSKEEVLDALIDNQVLKFEEHAKSVVEDTGLTATEKLFRIIMGDKDKEKDMLIETLHKSNNEKLHLKSITASILALTPYLAQVVEEGVKEGIFNTPYPKEATELLLVSSSFLFDEGIFKWQAEEMGKKVIAFVHMIETTLEAEKGSLSHIISLIQSGEKL